ncbi:hypothetical protein SAMN06295967_106196 [Belliella buryatensis]|uniref:Uncharacterized protein n=1 Tax=Belliella buryatensis TaxID=1500549 RepID=A0A239DBV5_9BACT|nr:hypothetical protein SAMN06295967_106196 [Belliella buryatensis]
MLHSWTTGVEMYKYVQNLKKEMKEEAWQEFINGKGANLVSTAILAKESENRVLIIFKWK